MCHISWQRSMHVGHMASHVCGTWQAMCVTHGMPCVIMHGHVKTYKYKIGGGGGGGGGQQVKTYKYKIGGGGGGGGGQQMQFVGQQQAQSVGAARRRRRKGGKEKRNGGKERRKGGEERKRKEEKRRRKGRKRGKRKRKRKECCAMSRPGRQRTRNCATRGRFPPTLVILRLGAVVMAYGFRLVFPGEFVCCVCDCVMVKDRFHGVLGQSKLNIVFRDSKIPSKMANGGVPKFPPPPL